MIASFDYPTSESKWLQNKMKEYPSIRFEVNPFLMLDGISQFRISGNVDDMNCFAHDRYFHGIEIGFYKKD